MHDNQNRVDSASHSKVRPGMADSLLPPSLERQMNRSSHSLKARTMFVFTMIRIGMKRWITGRSRPGPGGREEVCRVRPPASRNKRTFALREVRGALFLTPVHSLGTAGTLALPQLKRTLPLTPTLGGSGRTLRKS